MKTLRITLIAITILFTNALIAQTALVGPISTFNVNAHSSTASKLLRMELVKQNRCHVLDEFDMYEVEDPQKYEACFAKGCLIEYGQELNANLVISGSVDKIGAKILISLKMIDVGSGNVIRTVTDQFADQEQELQRMLGIMVDKLLEQDIDQDLYKRLSFKNEVITSNNVGRVSNSGPRMGVALAHGNIHEFLTRPEGQGGLEMQPIMSNLGYQFEVQYVGTEKFSALFEFIPAFNGLEQGKFMPSVSILNGFRFGDAGWEFAFGPTFGVKRTTFGFFDSDGIYGDAGRYIRQGEIGNKAEIEANAGYFVEEHLDNRGDLKFSTRWTMAFGRTFRSGALNIPVNVFYSGVRGGGLAGLSVGFNITRSKKSINK